MLRHREPAQIDPAPLETLFRELGPESGTAVIDRALEELAARLARAACCEGPGGAARLRKTVRGLAAISEQLGLHQLAGVARDVGHCADSGDPVALAATRDRLLRLGAAAIGALEPYTRPDR